MSASSVSHSDSRQVAFRAEAVHRLYLDIRGVAHFLVLLPALLVVGLWTHVAPAALLFWLVAAVCTPLGQFFLARQYFRRAPDELEAPHWAHYITWMALIDGIVWGCAGILFYLPDNSSQQLLLLALIIGVPAGSISSTSWWPAIQYGNAGASVGLTAIGLLTWGTTGETVLGVALLLYLVILYFIMKQAHATAMETIALRFDKEDLIAQLGHEKESAEQANLAKSKFLAAASHDLRQPLHALSLFTAALDEKNKQPEVTELIDNIKLSVNALDNLFNALLDVSRLDAGVVQTHIRNTNLRPLFQQLVNEYRPQAQNNGLVLQMHCDNIAARTDPMLLETILRNLISNALRYTPSGSIALRCQALHNEVLIEIEDSGIGISPSQQLQVYNEFVQFNNPERDRNKGLGLGLAIVKRLSHLLNHPLSLRSEPGVGTTFSLKLPLVDVVAAEPTESLEQAITQADAHSLRVLVIDDEVVVLKAMQALLTQWGYQTLLAESLDDALAKLQCAPHVIIADYRLRQQRTGVEAIRALHERWGSDIPALILTGDTGPEQLREVNESGYSLLHKPVQPGRLRSFLRQAVLKAKAD